MLGACGLAVSDPSSELSLNPIPTPRFLQTTPSPMTPSEMATPAPPNPYFISASPHEVCYGDEVVLKLKQSENKSFEVYWERKGVSDEKLPPLSQEHILLTTFSGQKNQEATYPFRVTEQMKDVHSQQIMKVSPGEYWLVLVEPDFERVNEILGAGSITVKDCS